MTVATGMIANNNIGTKIGIAEHTDMAQRENDTINTIAMIAIKTAAQISLPISNHVAGSPGLVRFSSQVESFAVTGAISRHSSNSTCNIVLFKY